MIVTHQTAPTQFVEVKGIRFAYCRFGKADGVPIVFNQHYVGTMDYWDPAVTDGLARDREVVLTTPASLRAPARCRPRSRKWARARSPSSRRSVLPRLPCASQGAAPSKLDNCRTSEVYASNPQHCVH